MSDLAALLARIEAAEGPDREIDHAISTQIEGLPENWKGFQLPHYTASLDAAVALCERVLPGWDWLVRTGPLWACVWQPKRVGDASFEVLGRPPALALCAAVVRAEIERRGEKP